MHSFGPCFCSLIFLLYLIFCFAQALYTIQLKIMVRELYVLSESCL